ncbi:MAG: site-2 protease family protein [Firmicutes bacterium]|nr:site-2 protease family protein [Bacillota bacterium]
MLSGGSIRSWIYDTLVSLPGIIVALTFHEAAHGYMSYWLGDPTPKIQGRLSLNPVHHIDPLGFLTLLLFGFGWGEPVQINPGYYKHRRRDEFLVSVAGVTMNLLIAVVTSFVIKGLLNHMTDILYSGIGGVLFDILIYMFSINIVLMVFNLLPVPPLDGFGILTQIFNLEKYSWYWTIHQHGFAILMLLIIFNITDRIIGPVSSFFFQLLL